VVKCLTETPKLLEIQKLLLLPKPGKPTEEPLLFRPICLIDGTGKLLEKLVCVRLERAISEAGDHSRSQFGFRKARSTVDAVNRVVEVATQARASPGHQQGVGVSRIHLPTLETHSESTYQTAYVFEAYR